MNILHLCFDGNFIQNSIKIFEKYYPKQNKFLMFSKGKNLKFVNPNENLIICNIKNKKRKQEVIDSVFESDYDIIILHGISSHYTDIIDKLGNKKIKVYWIFWGYELYQTLGYEHNYQLIDSQYSIFNKLHYIFPNKLSKISRKLIRRYIPDTFNKIIPHINYFCFWSKYDYNIFKKYFDYPIQYKYFAYSSKENKSLTLPEPIFSEKKVCSTIQINHQASLFGNHDTVFKRLVELDKDNKLVKLVPLSYGSKYIKSSVFKLGKKYFDSKFHPIMEYLPKEKYFDLISNVDVAIFGQLRQEASGNIIQLLKSGVKIFLRNNNSLLSFYKEKGYHIYSYEDDLNETSLFTPLTLEEKRHNWNCYINSRVAYEDFMPDLLI